MNIITIYLFRYFTSYFKRWLFFENIQVWCVDFSENEELNSFFDSMHYYYVEHNHFQRNIHAFKLIGIHFEYKELV
jgi:hypothetical protein